MAGHGLGIPTMDNREFYGMLILVALVSAAFTPLMLYMLGAIE